VISRRVGCEQKIQTADDVVRVVSDELNKPSIKDWIGPCTRVRVEKMDSTRDWREHIPALGVKLEGGLLKDNTGNHFFMTMRRRGLGLTKYSCPMWFLSPMLATCPVADVPPVFADSINSGSYRGVASPEDAICFIKKYISDAELAQDPLLVMTAGRARNFQLVPTTKLLTFVMANFGLTTATSKGSFGISGVDSCGMVSRKLFIPVKW
jgi:hypothetical protein